MKQLTVLLLLIPVLFFGQVNDDLAIWNTINPTTESYVTATPMTSNGLNLTLTGNGRFSISLYKTQNNLIDYNKYLEYSITANQDMHIELSQFNFSYNIGYQSYNRTPKKIEVRYSTSGFNNNNGDLLGIVNVLNTNQFTPANINFPEGVAITEGQTLKVRMYFYDITGNDEADIHIARFLLNNNNEIGPRIKGSVTSMSGIPFSESLVRWTKSNFTETTTNPSIVSSPIKTSNQISLTTGNLNNHNVIKAPGSWPTPIYSPTAAVGLIDYSKYVQFEIGINNDNYLYLDKFNANISTSGHGRLKIRFSKDINFIDNVFESDEYLMSTNWLTIAENLSMITLNSGEKLYIRLHLYDTNQGGNGIAFKYNNDTQTGPSITGFISETTLCLNSTTWNGSSWDNGVPTLSKKAILNSDYNTTTNGSFEACSCEVKEGFTLIIEKEDNNTNDHVIIRKGLINEGTVIVKNNANFIQIEDSAVNSGNGTFKVERITNPMNKFGYTYWGSPVTTTYGSVQWYSETEPESNTFISVPTNDITNVYAWNPAINPNSANGAQIGWVYTGANQTIEAGNGFIVKAPNSFSNTIRKKIKGVFTGVPQNGNITRPIERNTEGINPKMNFLSNPYPSAINIDKFLLDYGQDSNKIITPTVYLWTHSSTPTTSTNGSYSYESSDFATYTLAGGTRTQRVVTGIDGTSKTPKGMIASGQGFFIAGGDINNNTVTFKNSYRYTGTVSDPTEIENNNFFRLMNNDDNQVNSSEVTEFEKNRFWLNIIGDNSLFKQALVSYMTGATNEIDMFDGASYNGGNTINLYSVIENNPFTIQSKALPFENTDVVALGYKVPQAGTYTIELDDFDGLFENQNIYLKDVLTGIEHNLKNEAYEFVSESGTFEQRFKIIFATEEDLSTNIPTIDNNWIVYSKDNQFQLESKGFEMKDVVIYDMLGRVVYKQNGINSTSHSIEKINAKQVLIVKVTSTENQISTKKVFN